MIRVALLGATGSIGTAALAVARAHSDRIRIVSLAARSREGALLRAAAEFGVRRIALEDESAAARAAVRFDGRVLAGQEGIDTLARDPEATVVLNALVGSAGLRPTIASLRAGKRVALANKESVVLAGALLDAIAREHSGSVIPVDSEHSGIHQCLAGRPLDSVRRVVLTASGGALLRRDLSTLEDATPEEVLAHPTWSMGHRITVDSATLLNKGFELIEARWLFGLKPEQLDVVIHPQSVVHALVEFVDGSAIAQLSTPDMRLPILYALTYPARWESKLPRLDLGALSGLSFEVPDPRRSPGLRLARRALERGSTAPAVLNAADEEAVRLFLEGSIRFGAIPRLIEEVLEAHTPDPALTLESIEAADVWARARLNEAAASRSRGG